MKDFVHLHLHTEYSLLDGMCRIDQVTKQAHHLGMPAVAITDHGGLFGIVHFYESAINNGIKPIIGSEMYLTGGSISEKTFMEKNQGFYHLTVLAENNTGYENLLELSTRSYLEGYYRKPRIDKQLLRKYSEGLIVLSGCIQGEINQLLLADRIDEAKKSLGWYLDVFGKENFYLEMMEIGIPEQTRINRTILEIAKKLGIKVVATNDCHYLKKSDSFAHEILLCVQTGTNIEDEHRLRFPTSEFYFKTAEEMQALFSGAAEAIKNTVDIYEKCNVTIDFFGQHIPRFPVPEGMTDINYLENLVFEGLKKRFNIDLNTEENNITARVKYELDVIKKMNFVGYFLIIQDIVNEARKRNIKVGP
ncbi:MAG TPA: PHP domain-containing protein, partial [bacterium]|nr:PHP domain-containing protein [bacterium]